MDERDDDLELEIVDLDDAATLDADHDDEARVVHSSSARSISTYSAKPASLAPRFTIRQRRIQLAATMAIVSLLMLVLLSSYGPTRSRIVQTLLPFTSSPIVATEANSSLFYFDINPTWGQLFIDGKFVAHPPSSMDEIPLKLTQGHHSIRLLAQPFQPQQCVVSVPLNVLQDTCHLDQFTQSTQGVGAWLFSFPASLAQLPQPSFTALIAAVQVALDAQAPTETVLPGELYGINVMHTSLQRAREPLKATLRYQLDVANDLNAVCSTLLEANTACTFNGQECYLFCTISASSMSSNATKAWYVFAAAQATWEYTTTTGKLVAQHQSELIGTTTLYDHLLPLRIVWNDAHWDVTLLSLPVSSDMSLQYNEPCNTALNAVRDVLFPAPNALIHAGINWLYTASTNPAAGCLAVATLGQGAISPPPVAYFLYRFGVFLAANDVAYKYWPSMPRADNSEQQFAQQLALNI